MQVIKEQDLELGFIITMFSIWGIGVQLPRFVIRYGRSYPQSMNIHSISMLIIGLLTIMYVIARSIVKINQSNISNLRGIKLGEFILSWIMVVFILVQFILGLVTRALINSSRCNPNVFIIKEIHKILGYLLSFCGKIIIILVLQPLENDVYFRSWIFLLVGIFILWILMEVIYRSQSRSLMLSFPHNHKNKHVKQYQSILQNLSSNNHSFTKHTNSNLRYVIIDNVIYYIDELFIHPGSEYVLNLFHGKQINYLLKGSKAVHPNFPRHQHTKYVYNYLENRIIGKIQRESLLSNQTVQDQLVQWKITSHEKMHVDTYLITFQTDAGKMKSKFKIQNFGQYVIINCNTEDIMKNVQRPYSIVLGLNQLQSHSMKKFKNAYKYCFYGDNLTKSSDTQQQLMLSSVQGRLIFLIKGYKDGLFSQFLINSTPDKQYTITGPYGNGLQLTPNLQAYVIIMAAGTGVLPFVDLFIYLLQKTFFELISEKSKKINTYSLNSDEINYSQLSNLSILFIGAFQSSQQFYLGQIIKDLYLLNKKHDLKKFDMILRYQNMEQQPQIKMTKDTFNKSFIKTLIEHEKPDRFYYCGPISIEQTIRKVQQQMKLSNTFFYI